MMTVVLPSPDADDLLCDFVYVRLHRLVRRAVGCVVALIHVLEGLPGGVRKVCQEMD